MDHFRNPRNVGPLADPDVEGLAGIPFQGNFMKLQANLDGPRMTDVTFQCHGCGPTIAAGSMATTLLTGRSVHECGSLDEATLDDALGGVPPHKHHSLELTIQAVRALLSVAARETTSGAEADRTACSRNGG